MHSLGCLTCDLFDANQLLIYPFGNRSLILIDSHLVAKVDDVA